MSAPSGPRPLPDLDALIDDALEHAAHLLPAQAPIGDFVHHNTLHALQHLEFHDAIAAAHETHDAEGYLAEDAYRRAWRDGRIDDRDVERALASRARRVPDERLVWISRRELERLVLRHGVDAASAQGLRWASDELGATHRFREDVPSDVRARVIATTRSWLVSLDARDEASIDRVLAPVVRVAAIRAELARDPERAAVETLWAACRALAPESEDRERETLLARVGHDRTLRDLMVAIGAPDPAIPANGELVRFLGAFLDRGMARWPMTGRDAGLRASYRAHLGVAPALLPPWLRAVSRRLDASAELSTNALITSCLEELGVAHDAWHDHVARVLLVLSGWSGMVARLERVERDPRASLRELLAIRLVLDLECLRESARAIGHRGPIARLPETVRRTRRRDERRNAHEGAWRLFQLCQLAGIAAPALLLAGADQTARILAALDEFDAMTRRRVLHEAFEHHHAREVLGALADNVARPADLASGAPRFQLAFCIDDREEGIRRHFEALGPDHVTFGVAGFFGVAMQYRGLDDPTLTPLCPVVVQPSHRVEEHPLAEHAPASERRRRLRAWIAWLRHEIADASRSMARGAALTPLVGLLAALPLAARVLFPRLAHRAVERVERWLLPGPRTALALQQEHHHHEHAPNALGFTLAERADRVAGTLVSLGLTRDFAPLVVLLGHGASTVNNPHQSAYDCGACGGRNGGPNARAFAAMANEPAVREALRARGIDIPESTWFLGGLHDTTTDGITLFDVERVPAALRAELAALQRALDTARALSAHERCRRFEHAPLRLDPEAALAHVEERSVDLSQARPELGHATNAACIVGRRSLSRGLFLDRRAFLVSYDPTQDDARGTVLERILAAVVPVGASISLEYYFSTVDDERWGAGTKLPHNLAGLLGVMEGTTGDLRTGLPRQMTEVHEPVRLLCVIEASPDVVLGIAERQPEVKELVTRGWVRLACLDPTTRVISCLGPDGFAPFEHDATALPVVRRAMDWYEGRSGFVPPARIERASAARGT
ncbi:YbcC family protein [Sandaracinus amylolyticus]|uniref:YbcC family protein n=1 Tax=Sandaracinus amylolyticus TaxID=927083 RepID=UPI001F0A6BA3|nr:DUF2309 domain-containing protein [Sandaracinus amylolyticus]